MDMFTGVVKNTLPLLPYFYVSAWDLNPGPHAYMANALPHGSISPVFLCFDVDSSVEL